MSNKSTAAAVVVSEEEREAKREEKLQKEALRDKAQGKSGERSRFSELNPGCFYRFRHNKEGFEYIGELKRVEKGGECAVEVWTNGQPSTLCMVNFKEFTAIEISRAQCHDLSKVQSGLV